MNITRAVTKCDLIPPSALTETYILYTDEQKQMDTWTHEWTDKVIPVYPQNHVLWGYKLELGCFCPVS